MCPSSNHLKPLILGVCDRVVFELARPSALPSGAEESFLEPPIVLSVDI